MLLVLEYLHWADGATLDVLAFVLRTLRGARLLVVGSYRADDPGELLAGWLAETRRWPQVGWLELSRFTRAELAAQLAGLRGGPVDGRVAAEVFGRRRATRSSPSSCSPPASTGLSCRGCCGRCCWRGCASCHRPGQRLLRAAAVAGRWVCHDWLAAVTGGPEEEELAESLREAVDRGLLRITPVERAGQEVYEFRHALLQEAVYRELLPGQRARLHGAYASACWPPCRARCRSSPRNWRSTGTGRPAGRGAGLGGARRRPRRASVRARGGGPALRTGAGAVGPGARRRQPGRRPTGPACTPGPPGPGSTPATTPGHSQHVEEALRLVDPAADPVRAGLLHNSRGWYDAGGADPEVLFAANREAVRLVPAEPPSAARAQVLLGYGRALLILRWPG